MATERQNSIAEYMNGIVTDREFTGFEVSIIASEITADWRVRKRENIILDVRTMIGKQNLNKRIAGRVNLVIKPKIKITAEHIRIYKKCWADEYSDRTGKCAWGFKDTRTRLGYNPETGLEMI